MNALRKNRAIFLSLGIVLSGAIALGSYVTYALFQDNKTGEGSYYGQVGLRSYFQKGTGTEADPFVISRPIHFYNLTRLQNLGVFTSKLYFALGYDPDAPDSRTEGDLVGGHTVALKFYPNDTEEATANMISYLDMSVESDKTLCQIGTEGSPFYGVFDGAGKDIYGLTVHGGPEDVGVFGYTYSGSVVKNVGFSNLTVEDDGYSTAIPGVNSGTGAAISDVLGALYSETSDLGSLSLIQNSTEYPLTSFFTSLTDLYASGTKEWNVSLKATFPSLAITGLSYHFRSSSEYFSSSPSAPASGEAMPKTEIISSTGGSTATLYFNNGSTDTTTGRERYTLQDNTSFSTGGVFNTRFSIVAEYYYKGSSYSKVLSTYLLSVHNNNDATKDYSLNAALDSTLETGTTYAHGVNIGFLIGHCDGSANDCYVYGGAYDGKSGTQTVPLKSRLIMNQTADNTVAMAQESDTGLIGEYGSAISSEDTPQSEYDTAGDTGVLNFSKMYSDIVGSSSFDSTSGAGTSYYKYTPVDEDTSTTGTENKYLDVILNDSSASKNYISKNQYSIDFMGQTYIDENPEKTRGLGVFGIATSKAVTNTSSTYTQGLGDLTVAKGTSLSEFYYTTAEYHLTESGDIITNWSRDNTSDPSKRLLCAYYMPSYSSPNIWNEKLEKTFNFIIRCPLSNNGAFYAKNYFSNTTSKFLQDYFSYKLCDKYGKSLSVGTKNFGVFVKNVEVGSNTAQGITSFDSSLNMAGYGNDAFSLYDCNTYHTGTTSVRAPAKSINFSIESDYANVTVMAGSATETETYVGVYDKAVTLATSYNVASNTPGLKPQYAMYLPSKAETSDHFGYFGYDWTTSSANTDTFATLSSASNKIFCHTFKLPKGDYFLGSPYSSANIYYVCVQGQEGKGNTGNVATAYSQTNSITNVEFVSEPCSLSSFTALTDSLNMSFNAKFSNAAGLISYTGSGKSDTRAFALSAPANLVTLGIYNPKIYAFDYGDTHYAAGEKAALEVSA